MSTSSSRKRILIIQGHPSPDSLSAALAQAWAEGAQSQGHSVRWLRLGGLQFDPILHGSDPHQQTLEPDLLQAQQDLLWAEHTVWVFPVWWGGVPALLKGFLDRTFTSGFAFRFESGSPMPVPLLKGRTAELLVPLDTPAWYYRWVQRMPALHQMRITTLAFCGIRTVRTELLGPVIYSDAATRGRWLQRARSRGASV
jgi:putative NADPH-quinone reductase